MRRSAAVRVLQARRSARWASTAWRVPEKRAVERGRGKGHSAHVITFPLLVTALRTNCFSPEDQLFLRTRAPYSLSILGSYSHLSEVAQFIQWCATQRGGAR